MWCFGVVRGHPRLWKIAPFDRAHTHHFPWQVCSYCTVAPFLRYSEILVENRRFELAPPLFGTPLRWSRWNFAETFCRERTRVHGLSYGVAYVILCLAIFVQLRPVTDGRTGIVRSVMKLDIACFLVCFKACVSKTSHKTVVLVKL